MKRAAQTMAVLVLFGIIAAGGLVFVSNVWNAVDVPDGTDPRAQRDDYDPATARYDCRAYRGKYNFLIRSPEWWNRSKWWANRFACNHSENEFVDLLEYGPGKWGAPEMPFRKRAHLACSLELRHGTFPRTRRGMRQCVAEFRKADKTTW